MKNQIVEISQFKLVSGVSDEEFLKEAEAAEEWPSPPVQLGRRPDEKRLGLDSQIPPTLGGQFDSLVEHLDQLQRNQSQEN